MDSTPIADEAQEIIRNASSDILTPLKGECVLCFTDRQLGQFGCHNTLRFALTYRDLVAPRATALDRRLGAKGGYCDCEIFLNAYQPVRRSPVPIGGRRSTGRSRRGTAPTALTRSQGRSSAGSSETGSPAASHAS